MSKSNYLEFKNDLNLFIDYVKSVIGLITFLDVYYDSNKCYVSFDVKSQIKEEDIFKIVSYFRSSSLNINLKSKLEVEKKINLIHFKFEIKNNYLYYYVEKYINEVNHLH